jgi:hypothetical protein
MDRVQMINNDNSMSNPARQLPSAIADKINPRDLG